MNLIAYKNNTAKFACIGNSTELKNDNFFRSFYVMFTYVARVKQVSHRKIISLKNEFGILLAQNSHTIPVLFFIS